MPRARDRGGSRGLRLQKASSRSSRAGAFTGWRPCGWTRRWCATNRRTASWPRWRRWPRCLGECQIILAREMTKQFEPVRGEFSLIIPAEPW